MPNWCEGVLKVRGKKKDLINFVYNGIERRGYPRTETNNYTIYPLKCELIDDDELVLKMSTTDNGDWLHFKDSRRLFIGSDIDMYFYDEDDVSQIMLIDVKQAWCFDEEYFIELSKKFNLDFRIKGYECGCEFSQEIEVVNGELVKYEEFTYDDYMWEVDDPRLGG